MPALGKVTESVNAPALSAWTLGSAVTGLLSGGVSQSEIVSFAMKPLPEKDTAAPMFVAVPLKPGPPTVPVPVPVEMDGTPAADPFVTGGDAVPAVPTANGLMTS